MRNPDRIDPFLERLGKAWKRVPDWRFGQFMANISRSMDRDMFFPEDDEMIDFIEKLIENWFKK